MGDKKIDEEVKSLPSEISEDMWGELPKYQQILHQEQMRKEKEERERKKNLVRNTLEQQLMEQRNKKKQDRERNKQMDAEIRKILI